MGSISEECGYDSWHLKGWFYAHWISSDLMGCFCFVVNNFVVLLSLAASLCREFFVSFQVFLLRSVEEIGGIVI